MGDPPQIIEHQENVELEAQLVVVKADLKVQKEEVAGIVEALEACGRELSCRKCCASLHRISLEWLAN